MKPLFKEPRARRKADFYPTPMESVVALIVSGAIDSFPLSVWEPACGTGPIYRVLERWGKTVTCTDLEDYGVGKPGIDFLKTETPMGQSIVTNPPFSLAKEFIKHARWLGVDYVALLLKADYFCADSRYDLFMERPPAKILNHCWRLDFTGDGAPPMNCAWFVWLPGDTSATVSLLRKPK